MGTGGFPAWWCGVAMQATTVSIVCAALVLAETLLSHLHVGLQSSQNGKLTSEKVSHGVVRLMVIGRLEGAS